MRWDESEVKWYHYFMPSYYSKSVKFEFFFSFFNGIDLSFVKKIDSYVSFVHPVKKEREKRGIFFFFSPSSWLWPSIDR